MSNKYPFQYVSFNPQVFAVCRDCLVPMLGIRDQTLRDFCVDHTPQEIPETSAEIILCKGL